MKYSIDKTNHVSATGTWPKTKWTALRESIKKWEWLVKFLEEDKNNDIPDHEEPPRTDGNSCALCEIYLNKNGTCEGCPVMEFTGEEDCRDTPYYTYANSDFFEDALVAAKNEVNFLKSLLSTKKSLLPKKK